jgi:hypothetical protein
MKDLKTTCIALTREVDSDSTFYIISSSHTIMYVCMYGRIPAALEPSKYLYDCVTCTHSVIVGTLF